MNAINPPNQARVALKEWAVACEALGQGRQVILLRKGGIREEQKHFRVEHEEFLLFPTFEHQRPELVKPVARADLARILAERSALERVEIRYWARVARRFSVSESAELRALAPLHLWSDEYAAERLRWKPRHPLQVLALRVYRLPEPAGLEALPEYGGCKSWLSLAQPVRLEGVRPVLDDEAFGEQLRRVVSALEPTPLEVAG